MDRQFDKVVSIGCLEHAGRDGSPTSSARTRARSSPAASA
jgi:cyclopropane fatty-acyl-phospholipid synthase-like methyltransferase